MDATERAASFVATHGSPAEAMRLSLVLGRPLTPESRAALFAGQRDDGGFAPF